MLPGEGRQPLAFLRIVKSTSGKTKQPHTIFRPKERGRLGEKKREVHGRGTGFFHCNMYRF